MAEQLPARRIARPLTGAAAQAFSLASRAPALWLFSCSRYTLLSSPTRPEPPVRNGR